MQVRLTSLQLCRLPRPVTKGEYLNNPPLFIDLVDSPVHVRLFSVEQVTQGPLGPLALGRTRPATRRALKREDGFLKSVVPIGGCDGFSRADAFVGR
jgi:hypothetical protein